MSEGKASAEFGGEGGHDTLNRGLSFDAGAAAA